MLLLLLLLRIIRIRRILLKPIRVLVIRSRDLNHRRQLHLRRLLHPIDLQLGHSLRDLPLLILHRTIHGGVLFCFSGGPEFVLQRLDAGRRSKLLLHGVQPRFVLHVAETLSLPLEQDLLLPRGVGCVELGLDESALAADECLLQHRGLLRVAVGDDCAAGRDLHLLLVFFDFLQLVLFGEDNGFVAVEVRRVHDRACALIDGEGFESLVQERDVVLHVSALEPVRLLDGDVEVEGRSLVEVGEHRRGVVDSHEEGSHLHQPAHVEEEEPDGRVGEGVVHHLQPLVRREDLRVDGHERLPDKVLGAEADAQEVIVQLAILLLESLRNDGRDGDWHVGVVEEELLAPVEVEGEDDLDDGLDIGVVDVEEGEHGRGDEVRSGEGRRVVAEARNRLRKSELQLGLGKRKRLQQSWCRAVGAAGGQQGVVGLHLLLLWKAQEESPDECTVLFRECSVAHQQTAQLVEVLLTGRRIKHRTQTENSFNS